MRRLGFWLVAPTRRPLLYMAGGVVLLVGGAFVFNAIVQSQARATARKAAVVAAHVANVKLQVAQDLLAKQQHDDALANWHRLLSACGRGNIIRRAVTNNTTNLAQFELAAEKARANAARTDVTPEQQAIDLKAAEAYRHLRLSLKYIAQVDCVAKYPYPLPQPHNP